ncbi:MAG: NAD(P)/FAD-dependent oxidoreductase, partial [Dehalococcoidia bacterium]
PRRFAQAFAAEYLPPKQTGQLSKQEMAHTVEMLKAWRVTPDGTEGYRTAEVTLGGVDTKGLSSKTMEARKAPGLFFIGECVDVTGWLGGYNFQWAWASGYCAGESV